MRRIRAKLPLRLRVSIGLFTFGLVSSVLFSVAVFWASEQMELLVLNETLAPIAEDIRSADAMGKPLPLAQRSSVRTLIEPRDPIPAELLPLTAGTYHDIDLADGEFHVLVEELTEGRVFILVDLSVIEIYEGRLLAFLAILTVLLAFLSGLLGWKLTPWIARPVSDIGRKISDYAGDRKPMSADFSDDSDLLPIANAFDRYAVQIDELLRREREFTGMVSHELRTPIANISAALELLDAQKSSALRPQVVERIQRANQRMLALVTSMLELARADRSKVVMAQSCDVNLIVQGLISDLSNAHSVNIEMAGSDALILAASPTLVWIAARNLLVNALEHQQSANIIIGLKGDQLKIISTGAPLPDAETHSGLGLSIVQTICDRCGWVFSQHINTTEVVSEIRFSNIKS